MSAQCARHEAQRITAPGCAWCEIAQLRADLARVTAERDDLNEMLAESAQRLARIRDQESKVIEANEDLFMAQTELAETRKMLEALGADYGTLLKESNAYETALASTRAELARSEARVKDAHGLHIVTSEERQRMVQNELDAIHTKAERKVLEACAAADIEIVGGRNRRRHQFMFELQENAVCEAELEARKTRKK